MALAGVLATIEGWPPADLSTIGRRRYVAPMTVSADSVIDPAPPHSARIADASKWLRDLAL